MNSEAFQFIRSDINHLRDEVIELRKVVRIENIQFRKDIKDLLAFKWKLTGILIAVTGTSATLATWIFKWINV